MSKGVVISPQQAAMHTLSEAAGLLFTVPFFFYASKHLPNERARRAALLMGIGALAVDGFLLFRYLTKTTDRPIL